MFLPLRSDNYVIYDIRCLIMPQSTLEERIFFEATRRIPVIFRVGPCWGKEVRNGSLWIDEKLHDSSHRKIRMGLRANVKYVTDVTRSM